MRNYCFEGLASNSVTAVCGIGHEHCKSASVLWEYAINKLVEVKSPTKLIIYGGSQNRLPDFGVPVIFMEDYITKNFRRK